MFRNFSTDCQRTSCSNSHMYSQASGQNLLQGKGRLHGKPFFHESSSLRLSLESRSLWLWSSNLPCLLKSRSASTASWRSTKVFKVSTREWGANKAVPLCSSESMQRDMSVVSSAISATAKKIDAVMYPIPQQNCKSQTAEGQLVILQVIVHEFTKRSWESTHTQNLNLTLFDTNIFFILGRWMHPGSIDWWG